VSVNLISYEKSTLVTSEKYIGLDVHQATISVAVMDASGQAGNGIDSGNQSLSPVASPRLENGNGEAERFHRSLPSPARVGFEACGNTQWFEDLP